MNTNRPRNFIKRPRLSRDIVHNTFTIPSNFSGNCNYEGELTMCRQHSTPCRRQLTFRSDSEEEFSDASTLDDWRLSVETLRNRLFLYELSPEMSKLILKNTVYQKLVQIVTIIMFLIALTLLSVLQLLRQAFGYLFERRRVIYDWFGSWIPYVLIVVISFCGYVYCQSCNYFL